MPLTTSNSIYHESMREFLKIAIVQTIRLKIFRRKILVAMSAAIWQASPS